MPVSAKQLNLCDISTDFDKFYYQNQDDLLSLLNKFIDICDFIPFLFIKDIIQSLVLKETFHLNLCLMLLLLKIF